jgi:citrate lyase subunit beta/citryl-CoA lyase
VGRACIHPAQVAVVNEVFTPGVEEIATAQDLLDALAAAGSGVALDARGRMIDEAVARQARAVLARVR